MEGKLGRLRNIYLSQYLFNFMSILYIEKIYTHLCIDKLKDLRIVLFCVHYY